MFAERIDFTDAIKRLADLSGITEMAAAELEEMRRRRAAIEAQHRHEAERARQARIANARKEWPLYSPRSAIGEAYLETRGLAGLVGHPLLRFDSRNRPATPLFDLATGQILAIQARAIDNDAPRRFHTTGITNQPSSFGRWRPDEKSEGPVFIVEGFTDLLTGLLLFGDGRVLGAHNAGGIGKIVRAIAPTLVEQGRGIVFVTDHDRAGVVNVRAAIDEAINAGMAPMTIATDINQPTFDFFTLGEGVNDLNEAFQQGSGDVRDYEPLYHR